MKKLKRSILSLILVVIVALGAYYFDIDLSGQTDDHMESSTKADYSLVFPTDRYPETATHIQNAIKSGHSAICTIDRAGAEDNRSESLKGIPTKKGLDRDEWPMAMCAEGGADADIEYISPKDNRGAGSWVGNQLEDYPDGSRVEFIFP
ncbi:NucA/NucB deoxyribonuclease domain-containing protein [Paenibacillus antarcticus]|uniref:NucA/NucB deoxyribonuclease domain-containing protein n=1 Tax=Paenibacillus antarcticus TaxID=253703 RepID=UPI000AFCCA52|nr:NucA/NucB deoxyribonuclease domain-containing protein [Paenibacillus antarcticus]